MGRGPGVCALDSGPLMTTKDPGLAWLYLEEKISYREFEAATELEKASHYAIDDTMERKYWQGYHNAIINTMAALYGPTPLPGEDGE